MTPFFFFTVALLFVGLFLAQKWFDRYPKWALVSIAVASGILFPYWILFVGVDDWFALVKAASITLGVLLLSVFRTTRFASKSMVRWTTYVLLVANILEAVVKDASAGSVATWINVLTGLLLIATLDHVGTIRIAWASKEKDLRWSGMSLPWIVGYTLWNWVFLYLNFGWQTALVHVAVLGSALVVAFTDRDCWLQARVYTLATYFMVFLLYPALGPGLASGGQHAAFALFSSVIVSGFMVGYTTMFLWKKIR